MSGAWAPNACEGDERLGQQPPEGGVEFELTYKNDHTQEHDVISTSRSQPHETRTWTAIETVTQANKSEMELTWQADTTTRKRGSKTV